jgi:hypothetical protein
VSYTPQGARLGLLTLLGLHPIKRLAGKRGTGRRSYKIDNGYVDLLRIGDGSDSGIVFPRCGVQGWTASEGLFAVEEDLFLSEDSRAWTGLEGVVIMLIVGLDLENSAPGATLGLYIKPLRAAMAPGTNKPPYGMPNPCWKGGSAALRRRELGPVH